MHKLLKILLAGLVCLGSMAPAFADESAGVLPCTLTAENGTPVWQHRAHHRALSHLGPSARILDRHCRQPDPLGWGIRLPA